MMIDWAERIIGSTQIFCQRMERACLFCQVCDFKRAITNPEGGMWLAPPQDLRNDFVRIAARISIEAGT